MKQVICWMIMAVASGAAWAQNPICPPGLYIADPTARVWDDGMLYVYGSRDDEDSSYYCSFDYWVLRSPDLIHWDYFPEVFKSRGKGDQVPYNNRQLYAPDVMYRDGTYFLYFCQPGKDAEGVATSSSPTGPFTFSDKMNIGQHNQIDPGVFIDDDGQAYYTWGQFNAKIAKLKPNMTEIDSSTVVDHVLTREDHGFHEGNTLLKRNGIYYMVYACEKRQHQGRPTPTCIAYATSDQPMGPYAYGGIIIDNNECDPDAWNNHGSIVEFKGQWYVFYHRATQASRRMRKACIEPIEFLEDGSIPEVEMTSQGASGKPLDAFGMIQAERACRMKGHVRIQSLHIDPDNPVSPLNNDQLAGIKNGDYAEYRYVDFGNGAGKVEFNVLPAKQAFRIDVVLDSPDGNVAGSVQVPAAGPGERPEWQTVGGNVSVRGIHAVYLRFSAIISEADAELAVDEYIFHAVSSRIP